MNQTQYNNILSKLYNFEDELFFEEGDDFSCEEVLSQLSIGTEEMY